MNEGVKLVKNTTLYAIGDLVPRLFSFIIFPVLTKHLSPSEFGIINYVNTTNTFLLVFSVLCLNTFYLVYYYKQPDEKSQKILSGNLTGFVWGFTIVLSIIFSLTGFIWGDSIFNQIEFYPYILLGIFINIFNVTAVFPLATYRLKENPLPLVIINVTRSFLTLIVTVILVVYFNQKALGVLCSNLVVNFLFAILYVKISIKNSIFKINGKLIKDALKFSLPLIPGSLAYYAISMSDRFFIEKYLGLGKLGLYSTAATIAMMLNIVSSSSYKALEPYIFKIYGNDNFKQTFVKIHNIFFCVLLLCSSAIVIFSDVFYELFSTKNYHEASNYVPILIIGVFASSLSLLYSTVITAMAKTKLNSLIVFVSAVFSIAMNVIFLPIYGIYVAVFTSMLTFVLMLTLNLIFSKIRFNIGFALLALALTVACTIFNLCITKNIDVWSNVAIDSITFIVIVLIIGFMLKKYISYGKILDKILIRKRTR